MVTYGHKSNVLHDAGIQFIRKYVVACVLISPYQLRLNYKESEKRLQ